MISRRALFVGSGCWAVSYGSGYSQLLSLTGAGLGAAGSGPSGYSCNMTAGVYSGVVFGYSDGSGLPAFGSIDAEPIPGHNLIANVSGFSQAITFAGDAVSLLSGLTVWVNGIQYATNFSGWGLSGSDTQGSWSSDGPDYADGNSYLIEIK